MGKELLVLDALEPDRDFITINGTAYFLRCQEELSISEIARIRRESQAVLDSGAASEMNEEDAKKAESFINDIIATVVLHLDGDLLTKLTTDQKFKIVSAFTAVAALKRAEAVTEGTSPPITGG